MMISQLRAVCFASEFLEALSLASELLLPRGAIDHTQKQLAGEMAMKWCRLLCTALQGFTHASVAEGSCRGRDRCARR